MVNDMESPKYCVFLKSTLLPNELEFFDNFCFRIIQPQGEPLIQAGLLRSPLIQTLGNP